MTIKFLTKDLTCTECPLHDEGLCKYDARIVPKEELNNPTCDFAKYQIVDLTLENVEG